MLGVVDNFARIFLVGREGYAQYVRILRHVYDLSWRHQVISLPISRLDKNLIEFPHYISLLIK